MDKAASPQRPRRSLEGYAPLAKGNVELKVDFALSGKSDELGKGATVTPTVNGNRVAEGELPKTIPAEIDRRRAAYG